MDKKHCFLSDDSDIFVLFTGEQRKILAPAYDTACLILQRDNKVQTSFLLSIYWIMTYKVFIQY